MKLEIISMTPQERMYSYSQSSQIEAQTGCIGHLRGDFGAGQEFFTSWFEHRGEYKTDEFKAEFDEVVNSLREKNGLLFSRDSMIRYCRQRPEAEMVGNYCTEYGFKLKTVQHTYMLRCNPNYGDYNFYLYAYNEVLTFTADQAVLVPFTSAHQYAAFNSDKIESFSFGSDQLFIEIANVKAK